MERSIVFRSLLAWMLVLASTCALVACGDLKKIDEMRQSTNEMNQTTKELLKETKELHERTRDLYEETGKVRSQTADLGRSTDDLVRITRDRLGNRMDSVDRGFGELYDALRQGDSANLRRTSFQKMLEAKTFPNRMAEAGLFVMAFEYQLFSGIGQDTSLDRKNLLYHQAMMELFLRVDELAPKGEKIWPLANPNARTRSAENRASAFNCLAAVLHRTNRKQEIDRATGDQVSLYDLIIQALKMKPKLDTGAKRLQQGPHFAKEVLARPQRVRQLLQTRYNMFVLLMLGSTTDLLSKGSLGRALEILNGIEIDLESDEMGAAHLDFLIEEVLKPAAETKRDMLAVGIRPQLTRSMSWIASRLSLKEGSKANPYLANRRATVRALWAEYLDVKTDKEDYAAPQRKME